MNSSGPSELSILRNQYADQHDRDAVDKAFWHSATGDPETTPVQFAVLVAANAQLMKTYPGQLKKVFEQQTAATVKALEALPTPEQISELGKGMGEVRDAYHKLQAASGMQQDSLLVKWAKRLAIGLIALLIGILIGQVNGIRQEDDRVERVINAQPAASRVPLWLAAHGGSISIGVIKSADGKSEQQGIIIQPGALKFAQPTFSLEGGNALVPIE